MLSQEKLLKTFLLYLQIPHEISLFFFPVVSSIMLQILTYNIK